MRSSRGHSTPSLKISCKSVQSFCQNKPFSHNVADKEISIAASRGFSELIQNVITSFHGNSTPSLKISCKSVQPFRQNTKRHRRQTTDRQTDRQTTCCDKGATDSTVGQKLERHKGRKYLTLVAPSDEQYYILNFYASQGVCLAKLLSHLPKKPLNFIYTFKYQTLPAICSKNVSWLHFSWPTLYITSLR